MREFSITVSKGPKDNPRGMPVSLDPKDPVGSLVLALSSSPPTLESWWSVHRWQGDYRKTDAWLSAVAAVSDLDYSAATGIPSNDHVPPSPQDKARFDAVSSSLPGTHYHTTPRGLRVIAVFAAPVSDADAWTKASEGFAHELAVWLRANRLDADPATHLPGYEIDTTAIRDCARFMYGPRALVSGIQRNSTVHVLRAEPADPAELAKHAPVSLPAAKRHTIVRSPTAAARFEDAAAKYNSANVRDWGKAGSGKCPACGHKGCFGKLKDNETKWACFSSNHVDGCGTKSDACTTGDALDIDAFTASRSPVEHLRAEGYLAQARAPEEPPPPSDQDYRPGLDDTETEPSNVVPLHPNGTIRPDQRPTPAKPQSPTHLNTADPGQPQAPSIRIGPDEERVNDDAVRALSADQRIYQRGRRLVQTVRGIDRPCGTKAPDALSISEIGLPRLREMLANAARWEKANAASVKAASMLATGTDGPADPGTKKKPTIKMDRTHPPDWSVRAVHARERWDGIRALDGVVEWPVLRRDGTILADPGYDAATGLYYEPAGAVAPVPQEPNGEEVAASLDLLKEAVCDFPFVSPAAFSSWLAGLLTPLCRHAFEGPAPLFLVEASRAGSGKTLLWELVSVILSGRSLASTPYSEDDDEMGKKITACAIAGDPLIFLDNVSGDFGGAKLDQALTGRTWRDRILGHSQNTAELPLVATWFATGNNPIYRGDIERRMCVCRLESQLENPEDREEFVHADLLEWARQERSRLMSAALVILRAFAVAGRPRGTWKLWGSYEGWSRTVKGCIEWLGLEQPSAPRTMGAMSAESEELGSLIAALEKLDPAAVGITAAELLRMLDKERREADRDRRDIDETVLALMDALGGFPLPNVRKLGCRLRRWRGRVVGGRKIMDIGTTDGSGKGGLRWAVKGI